MGPKDAGDEGFASWIRSRIINGVSHHDPLVSWLSVIDTWPIYPSALGSCGGRGMLTLKDSCQELYLCLSVSITKTCPAFLKSERCALYKARHVG
jgi:hypothetical protein